MFHKNNNLSIGVPDLSKTEIKDEPKFDAIKPSKDFQNQIIRLLENQYKQGCDKLPKEEVLLDFHSETLSAITLQDYVHSLIDIINSMIDISESDLILSLIYIARYLESSNYYLPKEQAEYEKQTRVCGLSIHHLCLTSLLIAIKFLCDGDFNRMGYFAESAGVPLPNLRKMECALLNAIDHNTFVSTEEVLLVRSTLNNMEKKEGVHLCKQKDLLSEIGNYWRLFKPVPVKQLDSDRRVPNETFLATSRVGIKNKQGMVAQKSSKCIIM